jgi:hypothetical protein
MAFFIFWVFLSILVGAYGSSKKRSGVGWFFLSLIISPLITFIILLVSGSPQGILKKCPKCAEEVKTEAQVCRFCGFEFPKREEITISPKEVEKRDLSEQCERYRVRFNELADLIFKTKDENLKDQLRKEKEEIGKKLEELRPLI